MRFFKIKNKIKKSSSLDLFCCNFYDNNKLVVAMSFMTPPRLPICNYRCNRSPLFAKNSRLGYFLNAKSPQGGSYSTKAFQVYEI